MEFEWDPTKNEANIAKHGLDFADAEPLFENDVYAAKDTRNDYGEECWRGIGSTGCLAVHLDDAPKMGSVLDPLHAERSTGRS